MLLRHPCWRSHEVISSNSISPHFGNPWTDSAIPASSNVLQKMLVKALILKSEENWCEHLEKPPLWNVCVKLAFLRKMLQQCPSSDWLNFPILLLHFFPLCLACLPSPSSLSFSCFSFLLVLTPYLSSSQDQSPVGVCFSSLSTGADTLHVSPGYDL